MKQNTHFSYTWHTHSQLILNHFIPDAFRGNVSFNIFKKPTPEKKNNPWLTAFGIR